MPNATVETLFDAPQKFNTHEICSGTRRLSFGDKQFVLIKCCLLVWSTLSTHQHRFNTEQLLASNE